MPLTLRLDAPDADAVERMPEQRVFEAVRGITIGRDGGSGIVLVDRLRSISKSHCEIRQAGGVYEVLDHSRNGTFLNERPDALPRAVGVPLRAGDRLRVGCFTVTVLQAEVAADEDAPRGAFRTDGARAVGGSLGGGSLGGRRTGDGGEAEGVFGAARPDPDRPDPGDPGGGSRAGALGAGASGANGLGANALGANALGAGVTGAGSRGDHGSGSGGNGAADGFGGRWIGDDGVRSAALPELRAVPPDGPPPPRLPEPPLPRPGFAAAQPDPWRDGTEDDPLFGAQDPPPPRTGVVDHEGPLLAAAFARPRTVREAIPEEWDIAAELGLPRTPQAFGGDPALPPPAARGGVAAGSGDPAPGAPVPAPPSWNGRPPGGASPGAAVTGVAAPAGAEPDRRHDASPPLPPRSEPRSPPAPREPEQPAAADAERALDAFLRGCGLTRAELGALPLDVAMGRAGTALRNAMTGLHEMLGARSSYKQSFGVELTMVGKSRNNPLKFIEDGGDAVRAVMVTDMPGFLSGGEMVEEALHDIKRHQLAMITAMRAGLADLCRQLAPETIELSAGRPPRALRWVRPVDQARCWQRYLTVYDEITASLDNDALRVFGDGFARAYASAGTAGSDGSGRDGMGHDGAGYVGAGRDGAAGAERDGTGRGAGMRCGINQGLTDQGPAHRDDPDQGDPGRSDAHRGDPHRDEAGGKAGDSSRSRFGAELRDDVGDILRDRIGDAVRDGVDNVLGGGIGGLFHGSTDDGARAGSDGNARAGSGDDHRGDGGGDGRGGNGDPGRRGREGGHV